MTMESLIVQDTENLLFGHQGDDIEVYISISDDAYVVTWGDYIANAWQEKYPGLDTAMARAAVLVGASHNNPNFGFAQADENEFSHAWDKAMSNFVYYLD
jgi:mitochondrial fission protein ELM1